MSVDTRKMPIIAIVGRPNVGKSSLFNRFLRQNVAIVDDNPGITRDRHYAVFEWNGGAYMLVDTGGLLSDPRDELEIGVVKQIDAAIAEADAILFMVEPNLHPDDAQIADMLRRTSKPVLLAVNKVDNPQDTWSGAEFEKFGLGEIYRIAAKFGHNTGELLDAISELFPQSQLPPPPENLIKLAIVGRPNVGKSSLLNRLIGKQIALVHPEPGTTRDPVDAQINYFGKTIQIVDTAGLFRKQKDIEFFSALRTLRVIEECDVVLLLLDANEGITFQDKRIAATAVERNRGLILAVNKWDLIQNKETNTTKEFENRINLVAPFLEFVPKVFISALTGLRAQKILELVATVAQKRTERVPTATLNKLVEYLQRVQPPPVYKSARPKIFYATQADVAPPVFVFFAKLAHAISPSYRRYLTNKIRETFGYEGVTFKLVFKDKSNKSHD